MNVIPLAARSRTALSENDGARQLDDLLRRKLRVGDPTNLDEVSRALRLLYPKLDAANQAEGLGFTPLGPAPAAASVSVSGGSYGESLYVQTLGELRQDLAAVRSALGNREVAVELRGLETELPRELAAAATGARLAQDPGQRDIAKLGLRTLNDRADALRELGYRSGQAFFDFRRAATTTDAAADVVRVLIGEALAASGLGQRGWLLSVPVSDVRERGRAVLNALESLVGWNVEFTEANEQGQRFTGYRCFITALPSHLRPLVRVEGLRSVIEKVTTVVATGTAEVTGENLRRAAILLNDEVMRLNEVLAVVHKLSPGNKALPEPNAPLATFAAALALYLQAFTQTRASSAYIELALPVTVSARSLGTHDLAFRAALREFLTLRAAWAMNTEAHVAGDWYEQGDLTWLSYRDSTLLGAHRLLDEMAD